MASTKKSVRRWGRLSNDVMSQAFEWERRLIKLGVPVKDAERFADKCWRIYAEVLLEAK